MEHLDCPSPEIWQQRQDWFEAENDAACGLGGYMLSEQACALMADVQAVFCAGAWASVIILCLAVADAQLRETELPGFRGSTQELFDAVASGDPDFQWLRRRRNALVHLNPNAPAITIETDRDALEQDARRAVRAMLRAFYIGPWI